MELLERGTGERLMEAEWNAGDGREALGTHLSRRLAGIRGVEASREDEWLDARDAGDVAGVKRWEFSSAENTDGRRGLCVTAEGEELLRKVCLPASGRTTSGRNTTPCNSTGLLSEGVLSAFMVKRNLLPGLRATLPGIIVSWGTGRLPLLLLVSTLDFDASECLPGAFRL